MKNQENEIDAIYRMANVEPKTTIQLFEEKYKELKHKRVFIRLLAAHFEMEASSVTNHWIYSLSIPADKQKKALEFLTNYLKNQ